MLPSLAFCLKILLHKILDFMLASKGGPTDKNRVYRRKIPAWLVLLAYAIIAQSTPPRFGAQNTRCGGAAKNFSLDNCSSSGENNSSPHIFHGDSKVRVNSSAVKIALFLGGSRLRVGRNA